jgi:hypothetical protein
MVLSEAEASDLVTRLLYEQWKHGEQFTTTLPPRSGLKLVPGDLWSLPVGQDTATIRITRIDMGLPLGLVEVEAVLYEPGIISQNTSGAGLGAVNDSIQQQEDTKLLAWSSNALIDADGGRVGVYIAANGDGPGDWPGAAVYMSRDGGLTYQVLDTLADPVSWGDTDSTLAAPPANVGTAMWDTVSTVDVELLAGEAPITLSDLEVLAGANAVRFETGEVIQFAIVTAMGGGVYRLSRLLRGRQGTESYWGDHTTGEEVVFLEFGSLHHALLSDSLVNATILLRGVTVGQALASAPDVPVVVTGYEWRPWAGYDGRGERNVPATNDWSITWLRRARAGGDWVDFADAQEPDAPASFDLEVWDSGYATLKRTFSALSASSQVYTEAQQIVDFSIAQSTVYLIAYQLGRFGRGYPFRFSVTSP